MEDWKKKIKDSAEDVKIPEGLDPDKMQKKLEELDKIKKKKVVFYRRPAAVIGGLAAAVVLMFVGTWKAGLWGDSEKSQIAMNMQSEEAAYAEAAVAEEAVEETTESTAESAAESTEEASETAVEEDGDTADQAADEYTADEKFNSFYHTTTYDDIRGQIEDAWEEEERLYGANGSHLESAPEESADGAADVGVSESKDEASMESTTEDSADTGAADMGAADAGDAEETSGGDYSSTNLQVEGVDEGDIIKTDGTYIYAMKSSGSVQIIDAKKLKVIADIPAESDEGQCEYSEMYVDKEKLVLVGNLYTSGLQSDNADVYYMAQRYETIMVTYDLSNIDHPQKTGTVTQDGNYRTSRKVGDHVYIFSDYYRYNESFYGYETAEVARESSMEDVTESKSEGTDMEDTQLIPRVNGELIPEDDIYVPDTIDQCSYLVMSSVNLKNPDKVVDQKSLIDSGSQFYITKGSVYVIQNDWGSDQCISNVIRFQLTNGRIRGVSAAALKGELTDTFAINEYDGYLRVLLTDWRGDGRFSNQVNRVYVLDDRMKICGELNNIAKGETIYSARFMKDTGYFVTYRNTDPLFTIDLSDPYKPEIIGELKVTGFSEYLHFYGNGKLLGIGWETDPDTGATLGLKLSMYDISDPTKVKEENKILLKDVMDCTALYDYKRVLVDPEKNIIGFCVGNYSVSEDEYQERYLVFSYDEQKGFSNKVDQVLGSPEAYYSGYGYTGGLYIQNDLYVVEEDKITVYDMKNNFDKTGSLELTSEK
ncbi:MAG: hypothetical protein EOM40_06405 [Clostridia bacterium]|nr:hypothetical protein [Clostridia bacterium]NCC42225.1 hypothetical protein [Clostridia bacterium]